MSGRMQSDYALNEESSFPASRGAVNQGALRHGCGLDRVGVRCHPLEANPHS